MRLRKDYTKFKILIAGAGPAGTSLAIRLAKSGFQVCLVEREKFPRQKLCGEFISPECLVHFQQLNILDEMLNIGGDKITEIAFYAPDGKFFCISSKWFNSNLQYALSISRAEMDFYLMRKAKEVGVEVIEETSVIKVLFDNDKICGVKVRTGKGDIREITADFSIDATGRANVLTKLAQREISCRGSKAQDRKKILASSSSGGRKSEYSKRNAQNRLIGFKAHLRNVNLRKGICEIHAFRGGYGGLSFIENNLANHCFLIKAELAKEFSGDAGAIVKNIIFDNKQAFYALKDAEQVSDWLAVSIDGFGRKNLCVTNNLFSVGDAAAFIDPFTGSGMLMALESSEILAKTICAHVSEPERIAHIYRTVHNKFFQKRLFVSSFLRRAAFKPNLAKTVITFLSLSGKAQKMLARSTRNSLQQIK